MQLIHAAIGVWLPGSDNVVLPYPRVDRRERATFVQYQIMKRKGRDSYIKVKRKRTLHIPTTGRVWIANLAAQAKGIVCMMPTYSCTPESWRALGACLISRRFPAFP